MAQHRYWRLANFYTEDGMLEVNEIMLWTASANVNSSATITAVSVNNVSKWFDGAYTAWGDGANEAGVNVPAMTLTWDFGATPPYPDIETVRIAYYDTANRDPSGFSIYYSDNGTDFYHELRHQDLVTSGKTNYTTVTTHAALQSSDTSKYRPPAVAPLQTALNSIHCVNLIARNQ